MDYFINPYIEIHNFNAINKEKNSRNMKFYIQFLIFFAKVKSKNEGIMKMLQENKDKVFEIVKEDENKSLHKDPELNDKQYKLDNVEDFCFFVFSRKYSEMNSFLKEFEDIRCLHKNIEFFYRWVYDVKNCFFKKSALYSQHFSDFFIHASRYQKIDDNVEKFFHIKKNEIERYVKFSEKFSEFEKTIMKEKKKIILSDFFSLMEEMDEYKNSYDEILNNKASIDPIYEINSEYPKSPRLFAFCEGILPENFIEDVVIEFEKDFNAKYSYDKHISNLKSCVSSIEQINKHLVKIFKYFFDEKLQYKNINSQKILQINFEELKRLIFNIKSINFQNIIDMKSGSNKETGVNIVQILENMKYIAGLSFIKVESWNIFRSYYESNINMCTVFLLLRKNTVQKFGEIFINTELKESIFNNDFFFYEITKSWERYIYTYEFFHRDLADFIILFENSIKDENNTINTRKGIEEISEEEQNNDKNKKCLNFLNDRNDNTLKFLLKHVKEFLSSYFLKKQINSDEIKKENDAYSEKKTEEIVSKIKISESVGGTETLNQILYKRDNKILYYFEITFAKCQDIEFKMKKTMKIYRTQLSFIELNSDKLNYKTVYLNIMDPFDKTWLITKYANEKVIDKIFSTKHFLYSIKGLSSNIEELENMFSLKSNENDKSFIRPLKHMNKDGFFYFFHNETKIALLKAPYPILPFINRVGLFSEFFVKYVSPENGLEALCCFNVSIQKIIKIEELFGIFKKFLDGCSIKSVIESIENKIEKKSVRLSSLLKIFVEALKKKLEFHEKYINRLNNMVCYLSNFEEQLTFILSIVIDEIIEKDLFKYTSCSKPTKSYFIDIKNHIKEYLWRRFNDFRANEISEKKLVINLFVFDERESVRKEILNKFNYENLESFLKRFNFTTKYQLGESTRKKRKSRLIE